MEVVSMKITKNNLSEFLKYYHFFHDSYITNVNYLIYEEKVEMFIDVCWSGEAKLKEGNTYETNKTKIKLLFNKVKKFKCKEMFSWDYIDKVYINYIKLDNKEYICFANNEENIFIYIVCNEIEYSEIKSDINKKEKLI